MNNILEEIWSHRDVRMDSYPLMNSPLPTMALSALYFYSVKILGPKLMRNREPIQCKNTMLFYNFVQVIFSGWILYELLMGGWLVGYSFKCEPLNRSTTDKVALRMANAAWWYYFSKFTEFFDTFFFVIRKKFDHVSTLHVLHHGLMPLFAWEAARFVPGGHESFGGVCNTFIHVVMYAYYFLSALGPWIQPYLWWKRYLTRMQMAQFCLVAGHSFLLAFDNSCGFPVVQSMISTSFMTLFLVLFAQFYAKTYKNRKISNQDKIKNEKMQLNATKTE